MAMMWYIHEGHTADEAYNWVLQYPVSEPYEYQRQHAVDYYNWLQQQPLHTPSPTPASTPRDFPTVIAWAAIGAVITGVGLLIYLKKRRQ
jgi:hypothetical protein